METHDLAKPAMRVLTDGTNAAVAVLATLNLTEPLSRMQMATWGDSSESNTEIWP